jgi:hypothetical protein
MGLALGAALAAVLWPDVGQARTMEIVPYPIVDVWPASVRFLRVDRGFPIREKDESAGYVLFDFTDGPKACKASLELIRATDPEGRDATRLAVSIPDLPKRYEQMLIDKLTGKLREDYGPPAPPPRHNKSVEPSHPDAAVPPVPPQILLSPTP